MMLLQALYDSEINFEISTFWDGGFTAKLGDEMNGYKEGKTCDSMHAVLLFLEAAARRHYPHFRMRGGSPQYWKQKKIKE